MSDSLIFIPDISGFTEFVNSTEQSHSGHIISELLETLIDANELDLQLIEIEGDALLFCKFNDVPSKKELMSQVEKMYSAFHQHLKLYDEKRICPCGACKTAVNLKLKFVSHAGDIDFINVKGTRKPHGITVVQAHRILKNSIPLQEYLLVSNSIIDQSDDTTESWISGSDSYDFGSIDYNFLDLEFLKANLKKPVIEEADTSSERDIILTTEVDVPSKILFEIITNLSYRQYWTDGIKELKYDHDKVNREGTKHICILNNGTLNVATVASNSSDDSLVLGEKTLNPPIADSLTTYYIVKPTTDENRSMVTFEASISGNGIIYKILKPLLKSRIKKILNSSINKLKKIAPELVTSLEIDH